MFTRFGFAFTILQLAFNPRLSFSLFNRFGGAVAVRAMTGILGKNALTADRSLNSLLNSSPLTKLKKTDNRKSKKIKELKTFKATRIVESSWLQATSPTLFSWLSKSAAIVG